MTEEQQRRTDDEKRRYRHFRLPLLRRLIGLTYTAESITRQRHWHVRRRLRLLLAAGPPAVRVVDMGCGLGDHLFFYAQRDPLAQFVGVDHELANVLVCRTYQRLLGLANLRFDHADFTTPAGEADADLAICSSVLQYQPDLPGALRAVIRRLKPGGMLLVYQDVEQGSTSRRSGETVWVRTVDELTREIDRAGCVIEHAEWCEGVVAQRAQSALRAILSSAKRHPASGAALLLAASVTAPLYLSALWLDFLLPHRRGAATLLLARRTRDVQRPEA